MLRLKPVRRSLFGGAVVWALCVSLGLGALAATAAAAPQDLELVSRATGMNGPKGDGFSIVPSVSADGRYVAFSSRAANLHPDDTDATVDVFVRDLQTDTTTLVSRADGADGADGNDTSNNPAISDDGRRVAFYSQATNLHPDDSDALPDVFVRDLETNTTTLVSRAAGAAGAKANAAEFIVPKISADGNHVAFSSIATNLHPDDSDSTYDVFVRNLQTDTTTLVSRAAGADGAKGNGTSLNPDLSADGRHVAFSSQATNLHPNDNDSTSDVLVRDLQTNTVTLVSRATGTNGAKGNVNSQNAAINATASRVAFSSQATNLDPADGDGLADVYLRDLQTNTTTLVSRATGADGAKGDGFSAEPAISADGTRIAFYGHAANLHPGYTDGFSDVFLRDVLTHTTEVVSRAAGATGVKGNAGSQPPAISADGRFVAFDSSASNLHPDDLDFIRDVFLRDTAYDTDGDGVLDGPDQCAGTPSGTTVATDGCPDPDSDGISTNAGDNCPNTANPGQANADGDAQGDACDADDDNDGVLDDDDACPGTPSGTTVRPNGCVNVPPVARTDTYTAVGGAPLTVPALTGVLANDFDAEGDTLTAELVTAPSAGALTLNANGSFTYTPGENTIGSDSFTYRAFDGTDYSNTVTVFISVQAGCEGRRATHVGSAGRDVITGTGGNDVIVALGGNDTIDSGSGNDIICAGSGDDHIEAGSGNDVLRGGTGHDRLVAGSGDDLLYGGDGDDVLDGGSDDDRLFGEDGADRLFGGGYDDHLDGGAGAPDRCDGQGGTDTATASCEQRIDVP